MLLPERHYCNHNMVGFIWMALAVLGILGVAFVVGAGPGHFSGVPPHQLLNLEIN